MALIVEAEQLCLWSISLKLSQTEHSYQDCSVETASAILIPAVCDFFSLLRNETILSVFRSPEK